MKPLRLALFAATLSAQSIPVVPVVSKAATRTAEVPGELLPYLSVSIHAKVAGYVEHVLVDRGSVVKKGDPLIELSAPEMKAQIAESESKLKSAESDRLQAVAQLEATRSTADRLKEASKTPGAIAGNELILADKQVEAAAALVRSREQAASSIKALIESQKELQSYLKIAAPFDAVVTERMIHPGALATTDLALLRLEQVSRLRLVVPVPEEDIAGIANGASVAFHVPAFPERSYSGTVSRIAHALDPKTRTEAVELDVANRDGSLAPGMYPSVRWPIRGNKPTLWVPKTSVVRTTERVFVIRDNEGKAQWVDVRTGASDGDLIEVSGDLKKADRVVRRATDEIRDGAALRTQ
jgi:RND family efflux transporter MFP subunit